MSKKILSLLLVISLIAGCALGLTGCKDTKDTSSASSSPVIIEEYYEDEDGNLVLVEKHGDDESSGSSNKKSQSKDKTSGDDTEATSSSNKSNRVKKKVIFGSSQSSGSDGVDSSSKIEVDAALYKPNSLTVAFYDAAASSYGFTWNTDGKPYQPMVQICGGDSFNPDSCKEYEAGFETESNGNAKMYVCKARATLDAGKTYSYRIYDKGVDVGSDVLKIKARNVSGSKFTFAHLADSQVDNSTAEAGKPLGCVLGAINSRHPNIDFLLHTGDVVQYGGSESNWRNMLDQNIDLLSKIPMMAIGGNHETSQYGGNSHHIYKHFNVKKPSQSFDAGYYYTFEYGNARFIMLNTNRLSDNKLTSDQYDWLVSTLDSNQKQWTIVAMHNPLYSVGKWGTSPSYNTVALALQEQLSDLFYEKGVDLVLQGHDHAYSYTYPIAQGKTALKSAATEGNCFVNPQGVIYSMHGPVGNQSRGPAGIDWNRYKHAATGLESSWAEITIDGNTLTVDVLSYNSGNPKVEFSYGIKK